MLYDFARSPMDQTMHDGGLLMGYHWLWVVFWAVVVVSLVWVVTRVSLDRRQTRRQVDAEEAAEEILRRRYAAGEMDREEFEQGLSALREGLRRE